MPGRKFGTLGRYAFNGKEQDPETKGEGAQYDYGFRIYDPRVVRFLSVDPLQENYPWLTPYQFASNSPIVCLDLDGRESDPIHDIGEWLDKQWKDMKDWDRWSQAAKNVNETLDIPYIALNHASKIIRKKDLVGDPVDQRGRAGAVADLGVDAMMWVSGEKAFGLFKSENVLEKQMLKKASAMGQVEESAAQKEAQSTTNSETNGTIKTSIKNGGDDFLAFKSKVQNAFKGIDKVHLDAAIGDLAGNPVIKNGKTWDHLTDITNHLKNLNRRVKELNKMIDNNTFNGDVLKQAEDLRSSLQSKYDYYYGALQRAANKNNKTINVKSAN